MLSKCIETRLDIKLRRLPKLNRSVSDIARQVARRLFTSSEDEPLFLFSVDLLTTNGRLRNYFADETYSAELIDTLGEIPIEHLEVVWEHVSAILGYSALQLMASTTFLHRIRRELKDRGRPSENNCVELEALVNFKTGEVIVSYEYPAFPYGENAIYRAGRIELELDKKLLLPT